MNYGQVFTLSVPFFLFAGAVTNPLYIFQTLPVINGGKNYFYRITTRTILSQLTT